MRLIISDLFDASVCENLVQCHLNERCDISTYRYYDDGETKKETVRLEVGGNLPL